MLYRTIIQYCNIHQLNFHLAPCPLNLAQYKLLWKISRIYIWFISFIMSGTHIQLMHFAWLQRDLNWKKFPPNILPAYTAICNTIMHHDEYNKDIYLFHSSIRSRGSEQSWRLSIKVNWVQRWCSSVIWVFKACVVRK